jgi:hypothetical protein
MWTIVCPWCLPPAGDPGFISLKLRFLPGMVTEAGTYFAVSQGT